MDWHKVGKYREWIEAAGFEDVQEYKGAWPSNTWPRDKHHKLLGAWQNAVSAAIFYSKRDRADKIEYDGGCAGY